MTRIDIINRLINRYGYKTYLEIGVQYGYCFKHIHAKSKTGVDPDPRTGLVTHGIKSDDFFRLNTMTYDIVFIDGLHEAGQVERDIYNSLDCLNPGGAVVLHDCLPQSEIMQKVPRQTKVWTGDVWKAFVKVRRDNSDLYMYTIDTDFGVGVIHKTKEGANDFDTDLDINYDNFRRHSDAWMNVYSTDQWLKYMEE